MARGRPVSAAKRRKFLECLQECGQIAESYRSAGIPCSTLYRLRQLDPAFARAWDESLEIGLDRLEDEAIRRALTGIEHPVFYQGREVGSVRRYSDGLLTFMLKRRRPERYRDRFDLEASDDIKRLLEAVADGSPDEFETGD